jgi:thioredoxin reductase (NADPH)
VAEYLRAKRPVILAVDDDKAVLAAVKQDLRSRYGRGYRIVVADGGEQALETIQQLKLRDASLALVVSDQRMPVVEGTEVLASAKKMFDNVKTVLLTAYADTDVAIGAINDVRLDYYILKPWDPPEEKLYPVLDDLLDDWRANNLPSHEGVKVVGTRWSATGHEVREFLQRNQVPMQWLDAESNEEAQRLLAAAGSVKLPLVLTPDGKRLEAPDIETLAKALGHKTRSDSTFFDLAIIGAGPGGLAAAVYGASEGLSTVCVERDAPGGQAGQSSRIENYLGFPTGISGGDLARRAVTQVKRFEVELLAPATVDHIDASGPNPSLQLGDQSQITCGAVILACGVAYNSLDVPGARELEGRGVFYGAAMSEKDAVKGEDVIVVGGANSAGQAAMYFSRYAKSVTILCRSSSLEKSMSAYLIDQIAATDNTHVRTNTVVDHVQGDDRLHVVSVHNSQTDKDEDLDIAAMFIFIGASPNTSWLPPEIAKDERGFVLTGSALGARSFPNSRGGERDPFLFETSVPGIFAVGDVRARSVKRVASAVGEGSVAVQFVHEFLRS